MLSLQQELIRTRRNGCPYKGIASGRGHRVMWALCNKGPRIRAGMRLLLNILDVAKRVLA